MHVKARLFTYKRMLELNSHGLLPLNKAVFEVYGLLQNLDLNTGSAIESDALALVRALWSNDHNHRFQAKLQRCAWGQVPNACTIK